MIIRRRVATWHRDDLRLSHALIDSFASDMELQALDTFNHYERGKQLHFEEIEGEDQGNVVEEYRGLNDMHFDLRSLFRDYFPSLQRRSAFLTVWGYFEHQLNELCSLYKDEKSYTVDLSDIAGRGIDRSTKYLAKVAGLNMRQDSQEWRTIKQLGALRNAIAHQDGKLVTKKGNPSVELISLVDNSPFLAKDGDDVLLKQGFVMFVVDAFRTYFGLIGESIKQRESSSQP